MKSYGIWSDASGGFIEIEFNSLERAKLGLEEWIQVFGIDPEDLSIKEQCPEHLDDDQIAGSCEICDAEDEQ